MSFQLQGLLPVAALALTLTCAEPVRALACTGITQLITSSTTFPDCAGRTVTVTLDEAFIQMSGEGPWDNGSPFNRLHLWVTSSAQPVLDLPTRRF
jgi:hypothetical protein